jgi:methionyl aminopeptidase
MEQKEKEQWKKAGEISSQIMAKAIKLSKPETPLLEIAEALEKDVEKLKVKWAFPINLSINEIAAHYSPFNEDKTVASGLLKIDLGISVDGFISDIARSVDMTPENKHKDLIKSSETALSNAVKTAKFGIEIREIGAAIHDSITKAKFSPVRNLSGHQLEKFMIHSGLNIPNYDNGNTAKLEEGIYAIEPFATAGEGIVQDSKPSGIYMLQHDKPVRDAKTREILEFIGKEYSTLPFSGRWIIKKFGLRALLSLKSLEQSEILHHFSQLVEKSRMPVSQCENTILVEKDKISVLTA